MILRLEKKDLKNLDNISVTAYRIISIFNMLLEYPCNDEEINEKLQSDSLGTRSLSQDTICIYINTLRELGCIISRPAKGNDFKYVLKYHPFKLKLTDEEIYSLIEIRKHISNLDDWKPLVNIDKLFGIIIENLEPEQKKKFSMIRKAYLRDIDANKQAQLINVLEKYCNKERSLVIKYVSPESGEKRIEIAIDKLTYENGALYLWGYNLKTKEMQYLRVDRIKEIDAINIKNSQYVPQIYCIRYKLTGIFALTFIPNEDEVIIEKKEKEIVLETKIQNKFKFIQKVLSYGNDCTVLSPESIKKEVISKLKTMLNAYKQLD
ncbi:MAG: WYL domain-containing protein [bacterium]